MGKKIEANKVVLKDLFNDFWFLVPEYQRPYVWASDNVVDLLEDLWFAYESNPDNEYFVGSLVLKKTAERLFKEYEVLDGQQRLTTFALLFAILKEKTEEERLIKHLSERLFPEEDPFLNTPERPRIFYRIRGDSDRFLREFIQSNNKRMDSNDISVKNMVGAIETIEKFFERKTNIEKFATFLLNKVVTIYVATENRDDAFRLFTILNNRGIPLTSADILKAINIGEIERLEGKKVAEDYAEKWEDIQNELGEDFDRFLGFIRTILLKEKARKTLLEEFEEKIYKNNKLSKGKDTVDLLESYYRAYTKIIDVSPRDNPLSRKSAEENNAYKNLITIMRTALPSTDWIPPLLCFYNKFGDESLLKFLKRLEFKFSSDWILYFTPTQRIENMNRILKMIYDAQTPEQVLNDREIFEVDIDRLKDTLKGNAYEMRFAKYVLLKYDYLSRDNSQFIGDYSIISVEHVLPQTPPEGSEWRQLFTDEEIWEYRHKLGNLVLLNRRKNSSLSNSDFKKKKEKYFKGGISAFPSINKIMLKETWKKEDIENRTEEMITKLTTPL